MEKYKVKLQITYDGTDFQGFQKQKGPEKTIQGSLEKALSKLLDEIQEGSLLILDELNRLGRTMVTMLVEVNKLLEKGVKIRTLDGRLDTSVMNAEIVKLIVSVMGYAAEMELKNIKRRTAEGRAVAKSRGVKFGAKRKYDQYQIQEIMQKRSEGIGFGTIARAMGMSRSTVQTIVNREVAA